jgi:hypothetical protein
MLLNSCESTSLRDCITLTVLFVLFHWSKLSSESKQKVSFSFRVFVFFFSDVRFRVSKAASSDERDLL